MKAEFKRVVNEIKDRRLREKVFDLIQNPKIQIGDKIYEGLPLDTSPASKARHHSYEGGLIQHTVSSSTIALTLCDIAERIYHAKVERDVVLAAIIIHDIMKPLTYSLKEEGGYDSSQLGEQIDHLTLIVTELIGRGFPLKVVHAVAAHHGKNGPSDPKTIEALICFLADSTDATLNGKALKAARYLVEKCTGERVGQLCAEEVFAIIHAKQNQGLDGVEKAFNDIKRKRKTRNSTS